MLQLLKTVFTNLPCLFLAFHFKFPSVFSRFALSNDEDLTEIQTASVRTKYKCTKNLILKIFYNYLNINVYVSTESLKGESSLILSFSLPTEDTQNVPPTRG